MSAIAAFLALSTTGAFAQEAPTVPMTPPVAAPPTIAQPAPAPVTIAPPAAQAPPPVIRVPTDLPAVPAPQARERQAAAAPARAPRAAPRQRAAEAAPARAAPVAVTTPVASTAAVEDIAPIAAPVAAPVEPIAEAAPPPAEKATASNDAFPWEIVGGAAALLIVGGAGLAFARRRRATSEVWEFEEAPADAEWVPTAEPALAAREEVIVAPAPERQPVQAQSTPTFAAAPSGSMGRHEAMAMAGPTPDNPFSTLSKRLARARFLDRQERTEYEATLAPQQETARKPVSAWEIAQRDVVAPAEQEVRRLQPGRARVDLKPGWTRN